VVRFVVFSVVLVPIVRESAAQESPGEPSAPAVSVAALPARRIADAGSKATLGADDASAFSRILEVAARSVGQRLVVSLRARRLWLMDGVDTLFSSPVGVGTGSTLQDGDREWEFSTPRGERAVLAKQENPVWVPPDWHYIEVARAKGLRLAELKRGTAVPLSGDRRLEVRGEQVGVVASDTTFVPLPIGTEIIFDSTLFIPPLGTEQRRIPGELGGYKLDLGDGYLLHGTRDSTAVGRAATHGCLRLRDGDIWFLYENVPVGTSVYIY
jgi:hypothetical protein